MAAKRLDPWRRCWRGNVPKRKRILIYDSNERVSLVDSRKDRFFEAWKEKTGGRIMFYADIEPVPFETIPLFLEEAAA
jgi:hypothetical protein